MRWRICKIEGVVVGEEGVKGFDPKFMRSEA